MTPSSGGGSARPHTPTRRASTTSGRSYAMHCWRTSRLLRPTSAPTTRVRSPQRLGSSGLTRSATAVGAPARSLVRAVPVWAWLTGLVLVSALARYLLARRVAAPWIMVDELIYSELAKGVAEGEGFSIRGVPTHAYGFVYPLVIAPAYLIDSLPRAYELVKAINAVVVSLAALPAYFLARRVLPQGLSLLAALLAVALPSLLY